MATQPGPINFSYGWPAAGDLSAKQYLFMEVTTGAVDAANAAGDFAVGVLTNKPAAAGREANVVMLGPTKVVAGAAITAGALVTTTAAGKAITVSPNGGGADAGKAILGRAMVDAAADGDIIGIWVNCINPGVAT